MDILTRYRHRIIWLMIGLICLAMFLIQFNALDWSGYAQAWGGKFFKAMSGAFIGWLFSRYVVGLDLSEIPNAQKTDAAKSQAILIGAGMIALTQ